MPTAHLISGLPCSGKTSYANALRETTKGVLLSLDTVSSDLTEQFSMYELPLTEEGAELVLVDVTVPEKLRIVQSSM